LNRRVSAYPDDRFVSLAALFQNADVAFTNLETLIHDYDGAENYPAAEAGWSWMRSPGFIVEELRWLGFDLVGLANNHTLDYSYGGLSSTWAALDRAGIVHAGTGTSLGTAREPRYFDTPQARVGLISMTSTFTKWSRAGASRLDMKGRPGVNPLGHHHAVDRRTLDTIIDVSTRLGWWVTQIDDREWLVNPAGLHNTLYRYREANVVGVVAEVDEVDAEANLQSVRDAHRRADFVIVHVHNHEWDPDRGLTAPPKFLPPFARRCIEAGADVFIAQGSHAPLRGIEIYEKRPIIYDPGDLFTMSSAVTRYPSDFYERHSRALPSPPHDARPGDVLAARSKPMYAGAVSPPGGYVGDRIRSGVVPVLDYDAALGLRTLTLHPFNWGDATTTFSLPPRGQLVSAGVPLKAEGRLAEQVVAHIQELSEPFGTRIIFDGAVGHVVLD
jgi:poly-gamma-glutamate capsule biosynthesis protein CapA/YwtB (metallophosphatase superfamily)